MTDYDPINPPPRKPAYHLFLWLAIPLLVADQVTKQWVHTNMRLNTSMVPVEALDPFLRWSYVANTGTIFGLLPNAKWVFTLLACIVTLALVAQNYLNPTPSRTFRIALGLILGGALGNLIDRFRVGYVIDFIDIDISSILNIPFADWYVFNIADMCVISGVIILAALSIFAPAKIDPALAHESNPEPEPQATPSDL